MKTLTAYYEGTEYEESLSSWSELLGVAKSHFIRTYNKLKQAGKSDQAVIDAILDRREWKESGKHYCTFEEYMKVRNLDMREYASKIN